MKTLVTSITLLTASLATAGTFKVKNPSEDSHRISVPINNISCVRGPFAMAQLQVILPHPVGSADQRGVLRSEFMGQIGAEECSNLILNLLKRANNGKVELEATVLSRSVVKSTERGSYQCEGAQQEVVSINIDGVEARESIYKSEGSLDCPDGIYPEHVRALDKVIYVLHEDGIPTKSEF